MHSCSKCTEAFILFYILGFQLKKIKDGNECKKVKANKVSATQGKFQPNIEKKFKKWIKNRMEY